MVPRYKLPIFSVHAFVEADAETLKANVVDCTTCPAAAECFEPHETRRNRVGSAVDADYCEACGAIGWDRHPTWEEDDRRLGPHPMTTLVVVDCAKHRFYRAPYKSVTRCALCVGDGTILENVPSSESRRLSHRIFLLFTVHAKVPVEERQRHMQEGLAATRSMNPGFTFRED